MIVKKKQNITIQWRIPYFPLSGSYEIYRSVRGLKKIIAIEGKMSRSSYPMKYIYTSNPVNSTNIRFRVNGVEAGDSGLYLGGQSPSSARHTKGVLLVVAGKQKYRSVYAK
jgi:hypothetical protein